MSTEAHDQSEHTEKPEPFVVDAKALANRLQISLRHLRRMEAGGALGPRPLRLGRSVRYSLDEVKRWINAGVPDRRAWNSIREQE